MQTNNNINEKVTLYEKPDKSDVPYIVPFSILWGFLLGYSLAADYKPPTGLLTLQGREEADPKLWIW